MEVDFLQKKLARVVLFFLFLLIFIEVGSFLFFAGDYKYYSSLDSFPEIKTETWYTENKTIIIQSSTPYVISLYESLEAIDTPHQKSKIISPDLSRTASTLLTSGESISLCKSPKTPILYKLINRKENKNSTLHPICTSNYGELIGIKNPCNVQI